MGERWVIGEKSEGRGVGEILDGREEAKLEKRRK